MSIGLSLHLNQQQPCGLTCWQPHVCTFKRPQRSLLSQLAANNAAPHWTMRSIFNFSSDSGRWLCSLRNESPPSLLQMSRNLRVRVWPNRPFLMLERARFAIKIEVGPWLPRETHFAFSSSTRRAYFKEGYSNNMVKVLVYSEWWRTGARQSKQTLWLWSDKDCLDKFRS